MRSFLSWEPCLIALKSSLIHFPFAPLSQLTQSRCHHYKYNLVDKKAITRESAASWTSIVSVWAPPWAKVVPFYIKIMTWEHSNIPMAQNITSAFILSPPKVTTESLIVDIIFQWAPAEWGAAQTSSLSHPPSMPAPSLLESWCPWFGFYRRTTLDH